MQLNLAQPQSRCLTRALPSPSHTQQAHCHRRQQRAAQQACRAWRNEEEQCSSSGSLSLPAVLAPLGFWLASSGVADAATDFSKGSYAKESYWATLGLFIISFPGLWSQIKRAPKSKKVRKTYEVAGPGLPDGMSLDDRARSIFTYMKKYNYAITETGEVINFQGMYKASKARAAALVTYVFFGLGSLALVLSIAVPFGGYWWFLITLASPLSGYYYFQKGTRKEDFKVKMVTSDDEQTTDITVEGDDEEAERLRTELGYAEKGKVYVKGLLENLAGEN